MNASRLNSFFRPTKMLGVLALGSALAFRAMADDGCQPPPDAPGVDGGNGGDGNSAGTCANVVVDATLITSRVKVLDVRMSGFYPYTMSGSGLPPKYTTETWTGGGQLEVPAPGCYTTYTNMAWSGSWAFSTADYSDTSTKKFEADKSSCAGNGHDNVENLKVGLTDSLGIFTPGATVNSATSRGTSGDIVVSETLSGPFSPAAAMSRALAHATDGTRLGARKFWGNFSPGTADQAQALLTSGAIGRTSPVVSEAEGVSDYRGIFAVRAGKYFVTAYFKTWNVGENEPKVFNGGCSTTLVTFNASSGSPYVTPWLAFPAGMSLQQGKQTKLVRLIARSLDECKQQQPGDSSGRLGSVEKQFQLGVRPNGESAGVLEVSAEAVSSELYVPDALQLIAVDNPEMTVVREGEVLRQVKVPATFVDVVTLSASSYELRFYTPAQVGTFNSGTGLYPLTGQPYVTHRVENPDAGTATNRIRFTEIRGSLQKVTLYTYDSGTGAMAMSSGSGLREEVLETEVDGSTTTETRTVKNASGDPVSVLRLVKTDYPFGSSVTQRVVDPAGAALTTNFTYYTSAGTDGASYGRMKQIVYPSGKWVRYTYDSEGRPATTVTQFLDTAVGSADNLNRVTAVTYGTIADQDGDSLPEEIVTTVESLQGTETGRSHKVTFSSVGTVSGQPVETEWDIRCTTAGAAWNAADNLVTKRRSFSDGPWFGQVLSEVRPNGTVTLASYSLDSGNQLTVTTQVGEPNGTLDDVVDGTRTVTFTSPAGKVIGQSVTDIASNLTLDAWTATEFDSMERPTRLDHTDGTYELRSYACCGLDMSRDRQGIVTNYSYNASGYVDHQTRAGLTEVSVLDPDGRLLSSKRVGSDSSEITTVTHHYDLAGRRTWSKDALNRQTTFSEVIDGNGHTVKTTTNSDGGTVISTYAKDGSLLTVNGTAATQQLAYEYGVDADGTFTKEIHVGGSGETTEWVKTYTDFTGRGYKRVYADAAVEQSYYNALGQLARQVDADGVTTLFAYNAKGEQEVTAVDLNGNNTIDFAGTDRITRSQHSVTSHSSYVVQRTTTESWETDSANTPVTVSTTDSTFDGLRSWQTVRGLTISTVTSPNGSGGRTVVTTAPDSTVSTQTFTNDRLQSAVTARASVGTLSSVSYAYDPHGRLASTSQLSSLGTQLVTTYTYFDDDQIHTVTTPDPDPTKTGDGYDAQTTTYAYDSAGRASTITQPDATTVTTTYWPAGQVKRTSGSRTYPVEYAYDTQGRVKTLTTWQDYAGNTGTAVTTWNYTTDRGFLLNKRYADNTGPGYTYKPSGRLHTRTWARGITITYDYNAAGDLTDTDYSDSTLDFTIGYDRTGRPKTRTDASGTCAWTYDTSGQLKDEVYTGGLLDGLAVHRTFDSLFRLDSVSALSASSALNETGYSYDLASRLDTVTTGTNTATYAYVANSSLVQSVTFKQSGTTRLTSTKAYDNLDRLTSISSQPSALSSQLSYSYTYNAANQRTRGTREDDSYWSYSYDALGQVNSAVKKLASNATVLGFDSAYTYDDIGNRKTATSNGQLSTYAPTLLNTYSSHTVPANVDVIGSAASDAVVTVNGHATTRQDQNFLYAATADNAVAGTWQQFTISGVRAGGGPGGADAIATTQRKTWVPKTPETFTYDADGNLTADGRWAYTWDGENRLIAMQTHGNILPPIGRFPLSEARKLDFAYDLQGRRISKKVSNWTGTTWQLASSTLFLYDGWNLIAEVNSLSTLTPTRSYAWGLDLSGSLQGAGGVGGLLFANITTPSTSLHAPCYDGNGNVIGYVDLATGIKSAYYEYSAFGETLLSDGLVSEQLPYRFSTKYTDGESSLLYYGLRYYSPGTGRWLSRDPNAEGGGTNLYGFVLNCPISLIDALGQAPWEPNVTLTVNVGGLQYSREGGPNGYTMGLLGLLGFQRDLHFGPDDAATKEMQRSRTVEVDRARVRDRLREHCKGNGGGLLEIPLGNELAEISPFKYPFLFLKDLVTNNTGAFVGSFTGGVVRATNIDCCEKSADLHFSGFNRSGMVSASHLPPILGSYGKSLFGPNPFGPTGPMHDFVQTFDWDESITFN